MALSGDDDREMKRYLKRQFSECQALMKLIEATPPHQIHRRRIEVSGQCSVVLTCSQWPFLLLYCPMFAIRTQVEFYEG